MIQVHLKLLEKYYIINYIIKIYLLTIKNN
jgi:hypothetical protein